VCTDAKQQFGIIAQRLQQQLDRGEAAALKEDIALALCSLGCCTSVPAGQMPCCFSEQLPTLQLGEFCTSRPKARSARSGQQRAESGTATARNFNYNSNTPYELQNSAKLLPLLPGGAASGAAAPSTKRYLIRSAHRGAASSLVGFALAKLSSMQAAAGNEFLWAEKAVNCNKPAYKGKYFDLMNVALFCCLGEQAAAGSKRKAGE
jgi:hypothetical protein